MIAFDTNHLVRHIVQDDPAQCRIVAALLNRETEVDRTVMILDLVLLETSWVLESVYGFDRKALAHVVTELMDDSAFCFESPDKLRRVVQRYRSGKADLGDYLIHAAAESEGLSLETFDKRLRKEFRPSGA